MATVYVGTDLLVIGASPDQVRAWQNRCTYANPEYAEARRSGRPTQPSRANPEGIPEKLRLWRLADDGLGNEALTLPRGLLAEVEDRLRPQLRDARICPPMTVTLAPTFKLRPYQRAAVSTIEDEEQGVIQAPTGSGKTVIGLGIIAAMNTPALFLVHRQVLVDQTAASMRAMLGISPGVIGNGVCVVKDVTIAMVQSLSAMSALALRDLTRRFGLVILDEAHHCPADSFRSMLGSFPARYRVGLTATPTRADGMEQMLFDVIGPIVHSINADVMIDLGSIVPAEIVRVQTGWTPRAIPMQKKSPYQAHLLKQAGQQVRDSVDHTKLIGMLVEDPERNQFLVDTILDMHSGLSLVLSKRVGHAKALAAALSGRGLRAEFLTGDIPQRKRVEILGALKAGTLPVLVSTPSLVGEGFDLPTIDTVFWTVAGGNKTETTQVLGRVLRPSKGKVRGRMVDFRDDGVPLLRYHGAERDRVYRTFERKGGASELPLGRTA